MTEQTGGAGEQGEAAQDLDGKAKIGQRGSADPGTVERQGAAEDRGVDAADGLEQPQVGAPQALSCRDAQDTGVRGSPSL